MMIYSCNILRLIRWEEAPSWTVTSMRSYLFQQLMKWWYIEGSPLSCKTTPLSSLVGTASESQAVSITIQRDKKSCSYISYRILSSLAAKCNQNNTWITFQIETDKEAPARKMAPRTQLSVDEAKTKRCVPRRNDVEEFETAGPL